MAQCNQRDIEKLLKSYDIIEVGQFLAGESILSDKEFTKCKSILQKKEIVCFIAQLLYKDSTRYELFRKAMIKFAMDTMSLTINQLSDWNPSTGLQESSNCLSRRVKPTDKDKLLHDGEILANEHVTTDHYDEARHYVRKKHCIVCNAYLHTIEKKIL